jgi:hypothetical protein
MKVQPAFDGHARDQVVELLQMGERLLDLDRVLKCRIERQGKQWKITALEPVEFFRD